MYPYRILSSSIIVLGACLIAFVLQIIIYSPISPALLELPPASTPPLGYKKDLLQSVIKIGEGILKGPEDVCVDKNGALYTASRDGWIRKMHANGTWEDWKMIGGPGVFGLAMSMDGDLIVCDASKGLLKVGPDRVVTLLASEVDGSTIRFADDAIEASDGTIYFSDASTKFGVGDGLLDLLEAKPNGRLLKYDPSTKKTSVVINGLTFPNGVALSSTEDFLVVCETWKFRCLKHWLKGESEGKSEIFIDNLPAGPDNIHLAPDGSFWIALPELRSPIVDLIHRSKVAKHIVAAYMKLWEMVNPTTRKATVVNVGADGKIIRMYDDSNGKVMSFVTSAVEFDGHLYLGTMENNFIGKLPLN